MIGRDLKHKDYALIQWRKINVNHLIISKEIVNKQIIVISPLSLLIKLRLGELLDTDVMCYNMPSIATARSFQDSQMSSRFLECRRKYLKAVIVAQVLLHDRVTINLFLALKHFHKLLAEMCWRRLDWRKLARQNISQKWMECSQPAAFIKDGTEAKEIKK